MLRAVSKSAEQGTVRIARRPGDQKRFIPPFGNGNAATTPAAERSPRRWAPPAPSSASFDRPLVSSPSKHSPSMVRGGGRCRKSHAGSTSSGRAASRRPTKKRKEEEKDGNKCNKYLPPVSLAASLPCCPSYKLLTVRVECARPLAHFGLMILGLARLYSREPPSVVKIACLPRFGAWTVQMSGFAEHCDFLLDGRNRGREGILGNAYVPLAGGNGVHM